MGFLTGKTAIITGGGRAVLSATVLLPLTQKKVQTL